MRTRSTAFLGAVLALVLPAALLHASPAQAAASVVLYDQTGNAATPAAGEGAANFSPSNSFGPDDGDRGADDFTVPVGATWAIDEIAVTGAFGSAPPGSNVNVYIFADNAGKPGAELFSQLNITATGAPNFVVPLTAVPALTAGTYWVTVQYIVDGGAYWSWGTSTVQRGNAAQWQTDSGSPECPTDTWVMRTTCWLGTNPDQVFALKGTDLTPSNDITLGKPVRNKKAGTATLPVTVPGAGTLAVAGKGVVPRQLAAAGAETLKIKVKAKGAAKKKLKKTGKVTVTVKVTYTPTGGVAKTVTKKVKLRKTVA